MKHLLVLLLLIPGTLAAQDLLIDGFLKRDTMRLEKMTVTVRLGNELVQRVSTTKDGKFSAYLKFNNTYTIEFSGSGYATKYMKVDTRNIPFDAQGFGFEYGGFGIEMIPESRKISRLLRQQPVARIAYDPEVNGFIHDRAYSAEVKAKLDKLLD